MIPKRFIIYIIAFCVLSAWVQASNITQPQYSGSTLHSYAQNSVLKSGKFVKIQIQESGLYRLTYEDIQGMGVNPANVRIFGYGGALLEQSFQLDKYDDLPELPIYMHKGADGVFNAGDYILFYGQGITQWKQESGKTTFTHTRNFYSNYGYYFVSSDAGVGKRITVSDTVVDTTDAHPITTFHDYGVYEKDLVNLIDPQGSNGGGREFYGETFYQTRSYNFVAQFPNIVTTTPITTRLDVAAAVGNTSSQFILTIDGGQSNSLTVSPLSSSSSYTKAKTAHGTFSLNPTQSTFTLGLRHSVTDNAGKGYLNYISLNVERNLKMHGAAMFFRNASHVQSANNSLYTLASAGTSVKIWNITDPAATYEMPAERVEGNLVFAENNTRLQQFVACDLSQANTLPKPEVVGAVANQNLHALSDIDYLILTHPDFIDQANTLAEAHRTINHLSVAVVTTEQVYNEFSSGTPDATAYRWVMKMLYDRANNGQGQAPRYLLLLGDGTFDNRKILHNSGENKILTYQSKNSTIEPDAYVTDDYFGYLDDNEGLSDVYDKMDIAVGRFPVVTVDQASGIVEKTIRYMQNDHPGNWKNQLCFLGDDGGNGDGYSHMSQMDYVAENAMKKNPSYIAHKIYLDAYTQEISASGEAYPLAKNKLDNLLRQGVLTFMYMGHGGSTGITNESMLTVKEIKELSNENLAFWAFGTCSFGKFDSQIASGAEEVILNPVGGAVGMFTAARTVYAEQNKILLNHLVSNLFDRENGKHLSIGDAIRKAKNAASTTQTNKLSFTYLGDPAVKLSFPDEYNVVTTKINNKDVAVADTLRALSVATIEGEVHDQSGSLVNDFNGTVHITVRDKEQIIITQDNHNEVDEDKHFTFKDRSNTLFNGKVNVTDGAFKLEFMLPKDIKYNYGTGDINYYAYNTTTGEEAQGSFGNFVVGGGTDQVFTDSLGPEMKIYLNSPEFVTEGIVNERPVFFAELSDENGINSVGSGIGHDLMLIVNNSPSTSYILNTQFTTAENDFSRGIVSYKLPELPDGKHTLTFRAWDLLNNSTTKSLTFEVVAGSDPTILSVSSYPNPVNKGGKVNIVIKHDRPEEVLETIVYIYDVSGRIVNVIKEKNANSIQWDMSDLSVHQGLYLYHVKIKTNNSEYTSKTNKIIVVGQ